MTSRPPREERLLCDVCFATLSADTVDPDRPSCPHCASEAIDVGVVPISAFLAKHDATEIARWIDEWRAVQAQFLPGYHAAKLKRMESLLARSRQRRT